MFGLVFEMKENTDEKGESVGYQHFLLLPAGRFPHGRQNTNTLVKAVIPLLTFYHTIPTFNDLGTDSF